MAAERVVSRRRHGAQLKALVLEQCAAPQASVAKVAMAHGLNANLVHGWRKLARERAGADLSPSRPVGGPVKSAVIARSSSPQFVPVSLGAMVGAASPVDIQIELRRGATAMKITWPISAAADCAAWMRELLR
jgi:transposase